MDDQSEVLAFLASPAAHDGADPVERIDTHGAHVFLAGDRAVKIKRAVRYDYMDLSTMEKRRDLIRRELELNRPAAPALYRDVVPITRAADGSLAWDGDGPPVEWALRMLRFPREAELEVMAEEGRIDDAIAEPLGEEVARYHAAAPAGPEDGADLIAEILDELDRVFAGMGETLGADRIARFTAAVRSTHDGTAPLLRRRGAAGQVRRCHGDLHLRNLVIIDGRPTPFDALEFNERLGTCDVLYDLAFLLMDLEHRGLTCAANIVFNSYLRAAPGNLAGLAAMPLFLSVRAAIHAMVDVQTDTATGGEHGADARAYLDSALNYLYPPIPCLVAIGGLSGSGKSALARLLASGIGPAPGAVHLRSDLERKAMLGVRPLDRLTEDAYDAATTARVYEVLRRKAAEALAAGHAVILDAAHLTENERDLTVAMAGKHPFLGLWLDAYADTLIARVTARRGDASDADTRVVEKQLAYRTGRIGWRRIDAGGPLDETLAAARALIAGLAADQSAWRAPFHTNLR